MKKTTNYQLNQWEKTDGVLMADFNADNAKLEAALNALQAETERLGGKSRFTKLKEIHITADATNITIDLDGVDWTAWDKVHLDCITTNGSQMLLYFNAVENGESKFYMSGSRSEPGVYHPRMTFYPHQQPQRFVFATYGGNTAGAEYTYAALKKLIIADDTMHAGAKFVLWGEK